MIKDYIINFWLWWYFVKVKEIGQILLRYWLFLLGYLNVVPMVKNFFIPLYQDYTFIGRVISFIIRFIWVVVGSIIQIIATVPLIFLFIIIFFLPIIPIIMILSYLIK